MWKTMNVHCHVLSEILERIRTCFNWRDLSCDDIGCALDRTYIAVDEESTKHAVSDSEYFEEI